ncbi:MAG: mercuric transporter MerT family protein [Chloroflexi bacterium]|nr:mercuric transporter MerT family protein [Chloroflexota bacterium]
MKPAGSTWLASAAAALSSTCCVLPVLLLAVGFTSLGPLALLMQYRPLTLTFSFLMLGGAFYWVYRPTAQAACTSGQCSPRALRRQRMIVWISALLMATFPTFSLLPLQITM